MSIFSKIDNAINKGAQGLAKGVTQSVVKKTVKQANAQGNSITVAQANNAIGTNFDPIYQKFGNDVTKGAAMAAIGVGTLGLGSALAAGGGLVNAAGGLKGVQSLLTKTGTSGIVPTISKSGSMDITSLLNTAKNAVSTNLNISGAVKQGASMLVPGSQSGVGIFSSLVNIASGLPGPYKGSAQVQTPVAASVGGAIPLASSGGVVVSIPPINTKGVSVSTTKQTATTSGDSVPWLWIILGVIGFLFFKSKSR